MKKRIMSALLSALLIITAFSTVVSASGESDLRNKLRGYVSEPIYKTFYDDFNGDGKYEMFALTGSGYCSVWYVSDNAATKMSNECYDISTDEPEARVMNTGGRKYLKYMQTAGNGQSRTVICSVDKNGRVNEKMLTGYLYQDGYTFLMYDTPYDMTIGKADFYAGNYSGMGRTSKEYWYYADANGDIKEYGGVPITFEMFRKFSGAQQILNMITKGQVYNILYRANGIININIIDECDMFSDNDGFAMSNIVVGYSDGSVWPIKDEDYGDYIRDGFYLPAINDSVAVYPSMADIEKILTPKPEIIYNCGVSVTLNGKEISFDQAPVMIDDRVMVPIRAIFEAMGYSVAWDGETQTAFAVRGKDNIVTQIGNENIVYNSNGVSGTYVCDVLPQIISERTLVPVRAIAESSGCQVDWDGETKTVIIKSDKTAVAEPTIVPTPSNDDTTKPIYTNSDFDSLKNSIMSNGTYNESGKYVISDYYDDTAMAGLEYDPTENVIDIFYIVKTDNGDVLVLLNIEENANPLGALMVTMQSGEYAMLVEYVNGNRVTLRNDFDTSSGLGSSADELLDDSMEFFDEILDKYTDVNLADFGVY